MRRSAGRSWSLAWLVVGSCAAVGAVAYWAYLCSGRTPGELMDYADVRLDEYPQLQTVVQPIEGYLREKLGAPTVQERARQPFLVPAPPPRRGPADIAEPGSVPAGAKVWHVGPHGTLRIANAAALAKDGDVVEIEAGDYHGDVAVWEQKRLIVRGVGGAARLFADGRAAEGKAIWVIRGGDFDIRNVDFIGAKVDDGNGAGIRFEAGNLRLRNCLFWGNQMGLLTSGGEADAKSTLTVEASEFAYSHVDGRWGHNLYVGSIHQLTVTGSYFHHAGVGHLLKSRAQINRIAFNRLTDESGGRASYEVEFPNGGSALLVGNVIQQQRATENSVIVSFGAEGYRWAVNRLIMGNNTLVNDVRFGGTFVRVAAGADRVVVSNNLLVGQGGMQVDDTALLHHNPRVNRDAFALPSRHDWRLHQPAAELTWQALPDPEWNTELVPRAQYLHPLQLLPLHGPPMWVGADQRTMP